MINNIMPESKQDITDYGEFPLLNKQKVENDLVFVSDKTGYIEKSDLEIMVELKVKEAFENIVINTEGLVVLDNEVYVSGDRLVKSKEIFVE